MKKFLFLICCMIGMQAMAQGEAKTWQMKLDLGGYYSLKTDAHEKAMVFDLGAGYNVNEYVYVGVATGVYAPMGYHKGARSTGLPLLLDLTFSVPLKDYDITPYLSLRGGYIACLSKEYHLGGKTFDAASHTTFDINAGVAYKISEKWDLTGALFFQRFMKCGDNYGFTESNIGAKIGANYHF